MIRRWAFPAACVALLALAGVVALDLLAPSAPMSPAARAAQLAGELRCPDCQGLSVSESHTTSAAAIRTEIDRQVAGGASMDEVRDYFVARYGEWILLEPRSPAWLVLPFALIVLGAVGLVAWLRTGQRVSNPPAAAALGGGSAGSGEVESDPASLAAARAKVRDEVEALDA